MNRTRLFGGIVAVVAACNGASHDGSRAVVASDEARRIVAQARERGTEVRPVDPGGASSTVPGFAPLLRESTVRAFEVRDERIYAVLDAKAAPATATTADAGGFRSLSRSAAVSYPPTAAGAVAIGDSSSGMRVDVSLVGAQASSAATAGGYLVYVGALGRGVDWLHLASDEGTEEFLALAAKPAQPIVYDVALTTGVAGLRLVSNTLEFLDATGTPRLRVTPPFLADAKHKRIDARLGVGDCAVDVSPAAPWDRSVTPPSAKHCHVSIDWAAADVAFPAMLDPGWSTTGSMLHEREWPFATVLDSGKVLVAGGYSPSTDSITFSDLFDPATGTWAATGSLLTRITKGATLTALSGTGKALIAGGSTPVVDPITHAFESSGGEVYDSSTGTWTAVPGAMTDSRVYHTATLLTDGRVLVTGGYYYDRVALQGHFLQSAELYSPFTNSWGHVSSRLAVARQSHVASLLPDGTVVIQGGASVAGNSSVAASSEIFDPATSAFATTTGGPSKNRLVSGGGVVAKGQLVAGGGVDGANGTTALSTAELFDTGTNTWAATGAMTAPRDQYRGVVLLNGQLLATGGLGSNGAALGTTELYNGRTHAWTSAGA